MISMSLSGPSWVGSLWALQSPNLGIAQVWWKYTLHCFRLQLKTHKINGIPCSSSLRQVWRSWHSLLGFIQSVCLLTKRCLSTKCPLKAPHTMHLTHCTKPPGLYFTRYAYRDSLMAEQQFVLLASSMDPMLLMCVAMLVRTCLSKRL